MSQNPHNIYICMACSRPLRRSLRLSSSATDDIFREPVWFIRSDDKGVYTCNPNVLQQLERIEKQLVVIAITGKYRTGKSYLMNRLAGQNSGFPLGASIESKTKGIWILCQHHPHRSNQMIVLLDTEGLGDIRKVRGRDGDTKIMTMALLLSSCFVYNIMSAFNADALEKLDFVGHIAQKMSSEFFPHFILAVRDFSLDLEDEHGRSLTPDQYLTNCLKNDPNERKAEINKTREFIRTNFPKRCCHVFERPCDSRSQFKDLAMEKLPEADLNPEFKRQSDGFVARILGESPGKKQDHVEVNGQVFCILVNKCVVDINNGCIPSMDDMFTALVKEKNKQALQTSVEAYSKDMEAGIAEPKTEKDLEKMHEWALALAIETRAISLGTYQALDTCADKFEEAIIEKFDEIKLENQKRSIERLRTLLINMYTDVSEELGNRRFHNQWGHRNYKINMKDLERNFQFCTENYGGMREMVFKEFVDSKEGINKMLELNQKQVRDSKKAIDGEKKLAEESHHKTAALETQHQEMMEEMQRSMTSFQQNMDASIRQHGQNIVHMRRTHKRRLDEFQERMDTEFSAGVSNMQTSHSARMGEIRERDRQRRESQEKELRRLQGNVESAQRKNNDLKSKLK